jgi:hypothetical protein
MTSPLKQYLILGIVTQFVVALFIDFGGFLFAACYRGLGVMLPEPALFIISIRHWAFVWPVAVIVLTVVLFQRARTDGVSLHLFAGMMLSAIAILIITSWAFVLPMFSIDTMQSNKSPEPTPIGHRSSAVAVHVVDTAWLSFFR